MWPSFCETCALCRAWWILEKDGIALRNETLSPQYGQVTLLHSWYVEVNTIYRDPFISSFLSLILLDGRISPGSGPLLTITSGMETQLNLVKDWNSIQRRWNIPDSSRSLTFLKHSQWTKYVKPVYLHIKCFVLKFIFRKELKGTQWDNLPMMCLLWDKIFVLHHNWELLSFQ